MNKSDCEREFGKTNVQNVVRFKFIGRHVDIGDHLHLGGDPAGDAVVCWMRGGKAAVMGVLFSDNLFNPQRARITVQFEDENGNKTSWRRKTITSEGGTVSDTNFKFISPDDGMRYNKINVKSRRADLGNPDGIAFVTVETRVFTR